LTHSLSPRTIWVPPNSGRRTLSPSFTLTGIMPPSCVRAPVPVAITTPEFNYKHPQNAPRKHMASEYFKLQIFWTTERRRVLNSTTFIASQYGHKYGKKWLASWKVYWQSRIRTEMSITKTHNLNKLFTKTYHIWNFIMPSLDDIPFSCISVLSTLIILISTKLSSAFALDSIFIVLMCTYILQKLGLLSSVFALHSMFIVPMYCTYIV